MLTFSTDRTITASGPALPLLPTGDPMLVLSSVSGSEELSEIYAYTAEFLTPPDLPMTEEAAANLDLKDMIGQTLTVSIQLDGMGTFAAGMPGLSGAANIGKGMREISGIVTEACYAGQLSRQSRYRLTVQPWLYLANLQSNYRIFQNRTVVEIIDEVLGTYQYSWDKRLSAEYDVLVYQVQYGETDFAFVQRLMQEHGIYWFFEHSNGFHRMVLVDQLGAHKPVESQAYQTLWYYPPGHKIDMEYIDTFDTVASIQSGRWTTSDFNFKKPKASLTAGNSLTRDTPHNQLERYEWPGDYADASTGEKIALVRMQEVYAHGERCWGSGNVRDVVCGTTFSLEGYPQNSANREYLVIGAWLRAAEVNAATGGGQYSITTSFIVQPATTVFRPARTAPKPRTTGPQTAVVTGPEGQEIWTDQYGRVKLKFHWDRSPVNDQRSSCWVRVSYPWAGSNFGGVNVPRVGTEVIVDFENGDPDRPIVVGRVFNAATMPPWKLPDNATQSGLLSRSMKGGYGNANGLRFEDKQGQEHVWLQAERDLQVEAENDETHTVGNDRNKKVGHNEEVNVGGKQTQTIGGNVKLTTTGTSTDGGPGDISITSNQGKIHIKAQTEILFEVGGSAIRMTADGNILIAGPTHVDINPDQG